MPSGVAVKGSGKGCLPLEAWLRQGAFTFACSQVASKIPKSRHLDLPSFGHLWFILCVCVCVFMHTCAVRL